MGHLLVEGTTDVLEVSRFDPGNPIVIDDERCDTLLVELPNIVGHALPSQIESPRAFLRSCSCVWGNCTEVAAASGEVRVRRFNERGVDAAVDLRFPTRRVKKAGWFEFASPEAWNLVPGGADQE